MAWQKGPTSTAPLGTGQRFAALKAQLASRPGVRNPGALAASIGRKKFGKKKFASLSQHMTGLRAKGAFGKTNGGGF